jgi:hypothetical protein
MMGVQAAAAQLFYDFCLDDHVPSDHLLRGINRHLEFEGLRQTQALLQSDWPVKGSERSQRRISPRGHRPKPETTRPLETDENASANAGRLIPAGCLLLQNLRHRNQAHPRQRPKTDPPFQRYLRIPA